MSKLQCTILLCLLLFAAYAAFSQTKNLKFERLSIDKGLPALKVTCTLRDASGFLWIATDAGLCRFDGYNYKVYKSSPDKARALSNNLVQCMYEDRRGYLWIGTAEGVNKFDKSTETFIIYKNNYSDPNSISDNLINCIIEDKSGIMWIGTGKGGLNKFDGNKFISFKNNRDDSSSLSNNDVRSIYEDDAGNIWVGTFTGLNKYTKDSKFIHFKRNEKDTSGISTGAVMSILEDKKRNLWVGTLKGLYKITEFSNGEYNIFSYLDNPKVLINSIGEDENGFLWLACVGKLLIFEPESQKYIQYTNENENPNSLLGYNFVSINIDNYRTKWISSWIGISYYNPFRNYFNYYYIDGMVWTLNYDKSGQIYAGTGRAGLYLIDSKREHTERILETKNINNPALLSINSVTCINSEIPGILLIGFERDLYRYNVAAKNFTKFESISNRYRILSIVVDPGGNIWLGTTMGIYIFDSSMTKVAKISHDDRDTSSLCHDYVRTLFKDKNRKIWAGTSTGLDKIEAKRFKIEGKDSLQPTITHYKHDKNDPNSISGNYINAIYEGQEGELWISTEDGLNMLDKNRGKFTRYTTDDGLPDNAVKGILMDNYGNLWVTTYTGISKFDVKTKTFRNYDKSDGLLPKVFFENASYKSETGELFFGGEYGFTSFLPENIKENPNVPPIVITAFKLFNKEFELPKSISVTDEIRLSYNENFFSFEFSALDYTNPMKNQYAYMLEGVDKDWIKTTALNREASYTDIEPGEYIFRVKGSNNDGVWNQTGRLIKIIITPPLWLTFWAKGLYILTVIGFLGFVRHRKLTKIRKEMKRQAEFTSQLIQNQEQERKRIAGELHDSLGQNLLMIKNKAVLSLKKREPDDKLLENLNEISELTSLTLADVRAITYNLRPYELDRIGLTKTIEALVERAEKSTSIKFVTGLDDIDGIFPKEHDIIVYRIIQECINNIVKHSGANEAQIVIRKDINKVSLIIRDNGRGFDKTGAASKGGFGLKGLTERVNLLKGNINIESKPGSGTITTVIIPDIS